MKKLMILMLVCAMPSLANAALTGVELSFGGVTNGPNTPQEIEMPICSFLDIDVHGPAGYEWMGYIFIASDWPGAGGEWGDNIGPPYEDLCSGYYFDANKAGYPGYPESKPGAGEDPRIVRAEVPGYGFGYEFDVKTNDPEGELPTGGAEFDFLYHCCGPRAELVTINLYDAADLSTVQDSIVIYQGEIPEPATILLLGLGGLAMFRSKRRI